MLGVLASLGHQRVSAQYLSYEPRFSDEPRWAVRLDIGGSVPQDAKLTDFAGPVSSDQQMKLSPGPQFDVSFGYHLTPWLEVGPEIGFILNSIDSIGQFSYPNTLLFQMPMMANVRLEYPNRSGLVPFLGAGAGGVASFLTFGDDGYGDADGSGSDIALAFQAFGGIEYQMGKRWRLGLIYRYLATDRQGWDIEWWNGFNFHVGVDSIRAHSLCLVVTGQF